MAAADYILAYLEELHKRRYEEAIDKYKKENPSASEDQIEEYANNLWYDLQKTGRIEMEVLEEGKYLSSVKIEKADSVFFDTSIPLSVVLVIVFSLLLIRHF